LENDKISVKALWQITTIATIAIKTFVGESVMKLSRKAEIMADAAYYILTSDSFRSTGNFFIDDVGVNDVSI
jgi:citronellol/citronellal dehydrogenase